MTDCFVKKKKNQWKTASRSASENKLKIVNIIINNYVIALLALLRAL